MLVVTILGFVADAAIVAEYSAFTFVKRYDPKYRHLVNAFGCFPIIAAEILGGAWVPLPLTVFFGALGWVGLKRHLLDDPYKAVA